MHYLHSLPALCLAIVATTNAQPVPSLSDWTALHKTPRPRHTSPYESPSSTQQQPLQVLPSHPSTSEHTAQSEHKPTAPSVKVVSVPATYFQSWLGTILNDGKAASCEWSAPGEAEAPAAKCRVEG
ncbi:hypothetical protein BDZ85DRAFT_5241 [Elsinoe ampelina]|uniref:Uncharacterized protein n=1 Tax=Elsinoe ampelina TaxID=302913 RepID=A0A6A6GPQ1_9PEZI|nr:hypothetical protein BDZ85DRAFT_5241 [Elsinoe ampelina]